MEQFLVIRLIIDVVNIDKADNPLFINYKNGPL